MKKIINIFEFISPLALIAAVTLLTLENIKLKEQNEILIEHSNKLLKVINSEHDDLINMTKRSIELHKENVSK